MTQKINMQSTLIKPTNLTLFTIGFWSALILEYLGQFSSNTMGLFTFLLILGAIVNERRNTSNEKKKRNKEFPYKKKNRKEEKLK